MIKLTPALAVAVAVLFTSGSPAAFAQGNRQAGYGRKLEHRVELFAAGGVAQAKAPQAACEKRRERASIRSLAINAIGATLGSVFIGTKNPHRRRGVVF